MDDGGRSLRWFEKETQMWCALGQLMLGLDQQRMASVHARGMERARPGVGLAKVAFGQEEVPAQELTRNRGCPR